jgi:hypothetical protein
MTDDIVARLRSRSLYLKDSAAERDMDEAAAEIEWLRLTPEQAYLRIVEGWLRDNRGIVFTEGAVDDLCNRIARAALEP